MFKKRSWLHREFDLEKNGIKKRVQSEKKNIRKVVHSESCMVYRGFNMNLLLKKKERGVRMGVHGNNSI